MAKKTAAEKAQKKASKVEIKRNKAQAKAYRKITKNPKNK